jgi:hypothetical protein
MLRYRLQLLRHRLLLLLWQGQLRQPSCLRQVQQAQAVPERLQALKLHQLVVQLPPGRQQQQRPGPLCILAAEGPAAVGALLLLLLLWLVML